MCPGCSSAFAGELRGAAGTACLLMSLVDEAARRRPVRRLPSCNVLTRSRRRAALCRAQEDLSAACERHVSPHQMGGAHRHARHLLFAAVRALGSRPERAAPGGAGRLPGPALLLLLHRDLAAGGLLPHRPPDSRGDGAVPDERARGPGVVRLSLPADGVDRPFHLRSSAGSKATGANICCATGSRGLSSASRARLSKHFWWLMIAWWTGGAWVLYFADAPTLVKNLATFQAPLVAYAFIGMLTFTTYALAGWMREQVCIYMCPWPRIQAALTDEYALNVTYRYDRGEPRASLKKAAALHAARPAGRRLHRLPAMRACLPDRRRYPRRPQSRLHPMRAVHRRLRRGDGEDRPADAADRLRHRHQHQAAPAGQAGRLSSSCACARCSMPPSSCWSARVMTYTLATRRSDGVSVIHDRNPIFVRLSDGALRNGYTIRILNKTLERAELCAQRVRPARRRGRGHRQRRQLRRQSR